MKIDERLVKVSAGAITIPESLKVGEEVALYVKGTVVKVEYHDNQDGTVNEMAVVKGELAEK